MSSLTNLPEPDALLLSHISFHDSVAAIVDVLIKVPNYEKLRLDISLTIYLLSAVAAKLPNASLDEQASIVIEALAKTYGANDEEMAVLKAQLAFVKANAKKLIKKAPGMIKRAKRFFFGKSKKR